MNSTTTRNPSPANPSEYGQPSPSIELANGGIAAETGAMDGQIAAEAIATVASSQATPTKRKGNPLINRNFALLWSGQAISILGDMVFTTTLVIWIATQLARGQSWAPLAVTGVLLAASVPAFLVGPFAGVFVDRMDKRRMMLRMDGFRALIVGALILATGAVALPFLPGGRLPILWTLGAIYAVVTLVNIADQFFRPAMMALIGDIVQPDARARAMGLGQVSISLSLIIGPALAAPLFVVFGAQWALLIDMLSFVVSFLTILAIRAPKAATSLAEGEQANFLREFGAGLRFYAHSRVLMTLLVTVIIAVLGAGALNTLDVFFATGNLHASVSLYGLLGALSGVGAIVGAILASVFAQRIGVARLLWGSLLALGVLFIVVSRMTNYVPALVIFALVGVFNASLNVAAGPLMLQATPRELLGRVNSVFSPAMNAGILLGTALAGYLDGVTLHGLHVVALGMAFGPVDTIYGASGILIALSAIVAAMGLRGVDRAARAQANTPTA